MMVLTLHKSVPTRRVTLAIHFHLFHCFLLEPTHNLYTVKEYYKNTVYFICLFVRVEALKHLKIQLKIVLTLQQNFQSDFSL